MNRAVISRLVTFALLALLLYGAWQLYRWAVREEFAGVPRAVSGALYPGVAPEAIDYVYLHLAQGQDLELQREPSGVWRITAPTEEIAREGWVRVFLEELTQAQAQLIENRGDVVPATVAGLEPPRFRITVGIGERRDTLLLGERDPLGKWVYARRPGGDVFLATVNVTTRLRSHAEEWVEKRLLRGLRGRITKVRVEKPDGVLIDAVRQGERWTLHEPVAALADSERISQLVRSLEFVEQEEVLAGVPTEAHFVDHDLPTAAQAARGELEGATRIEIGAQGEGTVSALFAAGWEQRPDWVPAVREDHAKLLVVARGSLNLLTNDAAFFREHRLLPPIAERAVSLRIERGDEVLLDVAQAASGAWIFAAPERLRGQRVESERVFGRSALGDLLARVDGTEALGFLPAPEGEPLGRVFVGWELAGSVRRDRVDLYAPGEIVPARTTERPQEGLALPLEILELFDEQQADLLRSLSPLRIDDERWARLEISSPEVEQPFVLERTLHVGGLPSPWTGDDEWGRRYGLAHDMLRGFRGLSWRAAADGAEYPYRITFLDGDGTRLADIALRRPGPDEAAEVLGTAAAYAAVESAPGVELALRLDLLERFDELARPFGRKP